MKKKVFRIIQTLVFVGLGVFLVIYFWNKLSIDEQNEIIGNFEKADYTWMALAMVAGIISHLLRAARWNLLIETFDQKPPLMKTFWAVMAGYLANLAVPRLGEITRCAVLSKQTRKPFDKLLGSVFAERAFDMFVYLLLFAASIIIFYGRIESYLNEKVFSGFSRKASSFSISKLLILSAIAIGILLLAIWLIRRFRHKAWMQKISAVLRNIGKGLLSVFKLKRSGLFILYTTLIWVMYWLMVYLVYFSLPATSHLPGSSAFVVMIYGTIGIILIQGGIGIYPIIVSEVLLLYGAELSDGYAIGWLSWTVQTVMILLLGLVAFIMSSVKHTNNHESPPNHS